MTDLPAPPAGRLRKPSWRDSRLLVGLALVLLATALGAVVISAADDRIPVYAARHRLIPGQSVTPDDLVRVDVQLGDSENRYLSASADPAAGLHALREVNVGELVPRTALGTAAQVAVQPVTITIDSASASVLRAGTVADLWVSRPAKGDRGQTREAYAAPVRAMERISVAAVADEGGAFGGSGGTRSVQVMVPRAQVAQVVADVANESRITLVPVAGSGEWASE